MLCLEGENGEVGGQLPHLQGKMEGVNPHKTFNLSKVGWVRGPSPSPLPSLNLPP